MTFILYQKAYGISLLYSQWSLTFKWLIEGVCFPLQNKFLSFYPFSKTFNSDDFDYDELDSTDFVFMRWKVSPASVRDWYYCHLTHFRCNGPVIKASSTVIKCITTQCPWKVIFIYQLIRIIRLSLSLGLQEHFLVPDHTVRDINGASFAGFYYICFQKSTSTIEGYYYHKSSEWYQTLSLEHVPEKSIAVYEFR